MLLAILTFITGISISAIAIYYSVLGLAAIFSGAAVAIIVMGTVLELSKLVAAWWLKWNWQRAPWAIKTYLTAAVIVLMLITSMGIFGFLSRAHIEQTHVGSQNIAQLERIDSELNRHNSVIERAQERLRQLQTSGTSADANLQNQIDIEQTRIDNAYSRIQPAIDEQQRIIDNQTKLYSDQLDKIDRDLALLQQFIDNGEISKAQSLVGARADGQWGPNTAAAVTAWQERKAEERRALILDIETVVNNNLTVINARNEIQRLRLAVESQVKESNELINRLRSQLGVGGVEILDSQLNEQQEILNSAFLEIERLSVEKFQIETEYRKLEAEVGPIKYIAEFFYGSGADQATLEKAVTWLIIIIIFVFDPLAVLLLLASQISFRWAWSERINQLSPSEINNETVPVVSQDPAKQESPLATQSYLYKKWNLVKPADPIILEKDEPEDYESDQEIIDQSEPFSEKLAMKQWKEEHPGDTLKHQKHLLEMGLISRLPWESPEPESEIKKKDSEMDGESEKSSDHKDKIELGYVQNAEQSDNSIWQKVKNKKENG